MTYREIDGFVASLNYPYAYSHFKQDSGQEPPFICFMYDGIDDLYADNINYQRIVTLVIEFYSPYKDIEAEIQIESALAQNGFSYSKDDVFVEEEALFETIYTMEVVINGKQN